MKNILSAVTVAVVMALPLPAIASCEHLHFAERVGDREDVSHQELVQWWYDDLASADSRLGENENRAVLYDAILKPPAIQIPIQERSESGEIWGTAMLYYNNRGDLFYVGGISNFATIDGNLYAWEKGESTGGIVTRCPGDTLLLLDYLIDFSLAMRLTYREYLRTPELFRVTASENSTLLEYEDKPPPFVSLRFIQEPFWLHELTLEGPVCVDETCNQFEISRYVLEFGPPIPLEDIPPEVQTLPEGVTFSPTGRTVSSFMHYL